MEYYKEPTQRIFTVKKTLMVTLCQNKECLSEVNLDAEKQALKSLLQDKYEIEFQEVENCHNCKDKNEIVEISSVFQDLTFKEFKILGLFMSDPGRPVSRQLLISTLWADVKVGPKTLDVHLFNLRRKIRPKGYDLIHQGTGVWKLEKLK